MSKTRIAIHGACGRMGQKIVQAVHAEPDLVVAAALDAPGHVHLGRDIGELCGLGTLGVAVTDELPHGPIAGVTDFSVPEASLRIARCCADRGTPLLVATTGFTAEQRAEILETHHTAPLLMASNCSLVVNVLLKLAEQAAKALRGKDFDVEIVERHHRFKADAPSGTALTFAEVIEKEMGLSHRRFGRHGITGERPRGEIGIHALRTGDNVGEHTIIFSTLGETMELVHRGHSRESYVKGAVLAIKFLAAQRAGLYTMNDVLGF